MEKLGGGTFSDCTMLTNIVFGKVAPTICTNAFTSLPDAAVFTFAGAAATFQPNSVASKSGNPVKMQFLGRARYLAGWQALAAPNADVFKSAYVGRADFPGTANGYDTIGIVNAGTTSAPAYHWLIDTQYRKGLSIVVQ